MEKFLSIIIPCYNAEPYINELLDCLNPQITDEVEVMVIDDGSQKEFKTDYKWATVIRKENGGASSARNFGIDKAKGQYLAFIDADDLVSDKYIDTIIKTAKNEKFDYCYLSWKTLKGGWQQEVKLLSVEDKFPPFNLCVWNRVYSRKMIGDVRFNEKKLIAEDAEFIRAVREEEKKKSFISEFMYFYRSTTPNSLTKRFQDGKLNTKRVVYYLPNVTKQMTYLIKEFEELDKQAEIILLTNHNELPQLSKYAMVMSPRPICGTELRGQRTNFFTKVVLPIETQVVIYTSKTFAIGGIETFIYNFCQNMSSYYDILVLYDVIDLKQLNRLREIVRVEKNDIKRKIVCDTLIINRITDKEPSNVSYKKKVQMVHTCKLEENWNVPQDNDVQVCVSNAVVKTFKTDLKENYIVVNNLTYPSSEKKALVLVSATRMSTFEKGQKRMVALAKLFKKKNLPFIWICFSDQPIKNADDIIFMNPTLDISAYIKCADYLVQLSDSESFCFSIVEALEQGIPVLTTPLDVLPELGFKDGKTGYILPFDIDENVDVEKIFNNRLKGFEYVYNNKKRITQWRSILGNTKPRNNYNPVKEPLVKVKAIITYKDIELNRLVDKNEIIEMRSSRAYELMQKNFVALEVN